MLIPGILFFLIFRYGPMIGLTLAFKEFQPFLGLWKSPWVGGEQFQRLFTDPVFPLLFRNTLVIGLYNISFIFPVTIVFALMLNESSSRRLSRMAQTFTYILISCRGWSWSGSVTCSSRPREGCSTPCSPGSVWRRSTFC